MGQGNSSGGVVGFENWRPFLKFAYLPGSWCALRPGDLIYWKEGCDLSVKRCGLHQAGGDPSTG